MKITNPYNTTIRTNHEQPLESKKIESAETTVNNNSKTLESSTVQNTNIKQNKTEAVIPKEVQNIINAIKNKVPLNSEVIQQLTEFVAKSEGTFEQKLETLKMLLNKNLELTQSHLKAIHQALHGKININQDNLEQVLQQNKGQEKITNSEQHILNKTLVNELINQAREALSQELSSDKVIQNSQNLLEKSPTVNKELLSKLKTILSGAHQIKQGNEEFQANQNRKAQEFLLNGLEAISHELENNTNVEQESIKPINNKNPITNDYQEPINPINLQSKDIIVNTITKRLAEVTIQFRDLKREIARNVDQITTQTSQTNKNSYQSVKSLLESAINKLDNAILKSDIIYLTDMKTEKTLMQASSRLAEARTHLEDGNQPKATEILQEVKQTMDQLKWQPSDVKIKHFVTKESLLLENTDLNSWNTKHSNITKVNSNHEGSARGMFELIRSHGLNHDSEIAQNFAFNKLDPQQEELQKNMKAVIMKVLETGANDVKNPEARQAAENMLQNITGQQLLSKFDAGSNMQSMFFNLPYYLGEKVENIKVYINSRKDGDKIDWENSSLYFLVETKKLGETGILVSSSNRNLSITIKNDHPAIQTKLENLVTKYKDRIQEIGYQVSGIHFKKLNEDDGKQLNTAERNLPEKKPIQSEFYNPSKEGYDFRI